MLDAGAPTLTAAFTPTDTTNYNSTGTVTTVLNISKATPSIAWSTPAAITYGTALSAVQLNATASVPGTFAYTPAAGTVLNAGSQALSVTFTPYNSTNYAATTTFTVTAATPTLTFATTSTEVTVTVQQSHANPRQPVGLVHSGPAPLFLRNHFHSLAGGNEQKSAGLRSACEKNKKFKRR